MASFLCTFRPYCLQGNIKELFSDCLLFFYISKYLFIVQKNCFVSVKKKEKYWTLKKEEKKDKLRLF